ncbi:peptide ABC transporter substrate-binding protein [Butyrivibrio sp. YAB3001]|uniref:peptide ABC transporter substrate-binding protein n=1 Tax=Butyrivibrio sp. YAB3001 TaxID=1520812 RepID=UPI0008F66400|nr:peptide ABC transporter substrate-binding protein [Butyrivibrio sp. YAB3001]SFC26106.1 peptide/nickel transport system substrate-binding protein [Butyrivibrio sp. YAB3001]
MKNSFKRIFTFIISFSILFTGCSYKLPDLENHTLDDAYREDAKVYRTLYSSEVVNLNYLVTSSSVDTAICANVIDALVDYDEYGNIIPGLAESWESNEDMTKWIFHLRDDISWVDYNGNFYAKVTADDFVAAAEYVNNAANETDCQYMYSTGSVVVKAQEYYEYTTYLLNPELFEDPPEEVKASEIGVTALDDKTLMYELEKPCPFFLSVLSYTTYLPICRSYLKKVGNMFARNNKNLLYNGAYILHYFQPLEKQVLVKNPSYWDRDNVHIDRVENYYDVDAEAISVERYLEGSIDKAVVKTSRLEEYLENSKIGGEIHHSRQDTSFSYFYCFNFNPQFDEKYEPENWAKAVANENFRKAIMASIDRVKLLSIYEPYSPESLLTNTVTPPGAVADNGKDFTAFNGLYNISQTDSFNLTLVKAYRLTAKYELIEAGVTFPIKMLMPYNPSTQGWKEEALLLEQQIENALGRNFIDVIVAAGSDTGVLLSVRRSGKYAFMKCRWGADYADPQTWTEPFEDDGEYMFWHMCQDESVKKTHDEWREKVDKAAAITTDNTARFQAFAEAEEVVIRHAIVVPFSIMLGDGYVMSRLNEFEGEYSSYGMARQRFKRYILHDSSMSMEEYDKAYEEWAEKVME